MVDKTLYAFFNTVDDAKDAMRQLRDNGYIASIEKADLGAPNPDLSVSSLMVGFLPNMAHALFPTRWLDSEGAYLFVGLNEQQDKLKVLEIVEEFGGELLEDPN